MSGKKQRTLFGAVAKEATFYRRTATSDYEKIIEAYYFFHKSTQSKQDCEKNARKLWKEMKADQEKLTHT